MTEAMPRPKALRRSLRFALVGGLLAALFGVLSTPVGAQVLRGVVVDAESRTPLPAVLVMLLDEAGVERHRYLVDADGRFRFLAPGPGRYSVRAERLGAETTTLSGLDLADGQDVSVRIPMTVRAIALEGIEVRGDQRCELQREAGPQIQRVWEEARKALSVASLADSAAWYRYDLVRYTRQLDPVTLTVKEESRARRSTASSRPITSRPVEVLLDSGFVVPDGDGDRFFAPDAQVLLSDAFLQTHCLFLRTGADDEAGLLGLEFKPVRGGADVTDIEGTFWLSPQDGRLQWLDFRYTDFQGPGAEVRARNSDGRVEFRGLPDGTWIVSRWYIRMPIVAETLDPVFQRRDYRVVGLVEEGGRVVQALRQGTDRLVFSERAGALLARVGPMVDGLGDDGGSVVVIGSGARARPDASGQARLQGLAEGRYQLAYERPGLMGLDGGYAVTEVNVEQGKTGVVTVWPATVERVLASACRVDEWTAGTGVVLGEVVDGATGVSVAGARILIEWQSIRALDMRRVEGGERSFTITTDESGSFRACGMPLDQALTLTTSLGPDRSVVVETRIPPGQFVTSVLVDWRESGR